MKFQLKKLRDDVILPSHGSDEAAGWDLYAQEGCIIRPNGTVMIKTGVALAIPKGYVGLIFARSGMATKQGLAPANKVGVIDSDYRGEIIVALRNHNIDISQMVARGDRVAQLVIVPYLVGQYEVVDELDETVRGDGGFGSSGK